MPFLPLPIMVELFINGQWTDISGFVYERDGITISGGATAEGDTAQPAQATLTLNNIDGRFSPNYTGGAYYPYIVPNVQLRISIQNAQSSSGNTYTGYRFWGQVQDWPPLNDVSGHDVYTQIQANGPLRQVQTHGGQGSALTRYYELLTGSFAPIAYWPCEELSQGTLIGDGLAGSTNMTVSGTPKFQAISDFNGSGPIAVINNSIWTGTTNSFGSSGNDIFQAPGTYTWIASTAAVDCRVIAPGGGSENGSQGAGGGGGEIAREASLAVTIGKAYTVTILPGGMGGAFRTDGSESAGTAGGTMTFNGDAVNVVAHGGGGGHSGTGGTGGTGSVNTGHANGGNGGSNPSNFRTGAGGGSSAGLVSGTATAGVNGGNAGSSNPGNGGTAPTLGGNGGIGGIDGTYGNAGYPGVTPGGGGGGGGESSKGVAHSGQSGGAGYMQFVYTASNTPSVNVIRGILKVPTHGGNSGRVLLRVNTGSTVMTRLDMTYVTGGKLRLQGFNGSSVQQFDSTAQSWNIDGQTIMFSIELQNNGANCNWAFKSVIPGNTTLLGSASGTVNTAAVGNVSSVVVDPNADITKAAMGHISVQYAYINVLKVSQAVNGANSEMSVDRFVRLANEMALGSVIQFNEGTDHWTFEGGTQSWVGTNCTLTNPTTTFTPVDTDAQPNLTLFSQWPVDQNHSLLLTCNGSANPFATSPTGTSGQPVQVGDIVSAAAEVYVPVAAGNIFIGVLWYQSGGTACAHAEDDSADVSIGAGGLVTIKVTATAPATAAFFAIKIGDHATPAVNFAIYTDNVRLSPRMGPQERIELRTILKEIQDLDAGILKDAKTLLGMGYKTRVAMINQSPALTLSYNSGIISPPLAPVTDDKLVKNEIITRKKKGSKVTVTQVAPATNNVSPPPAGVGKHKHQRLTAAEVDAQLAALANHLLAIGTDNNARYPTVTVQLERAGIVGNAVAPLMSAIAGVDVGDYIQLTNLPFWFPATPAKQIIIGYTETLNAYTWQIVWNCAPENPFEIQATNLRRW